LSYQSGSGTAPACPSKCDDGSSITLYKQASNSVRQFSTQSAIQAEVSTNGPVEAGFEVYSDFFNYKSGVYVKSAGATLEGGHAIIIIGYGHDSASGLDYWLCSNSWGSSWGMNGYFKIAVGQCQIESSVYAGCPAGGNKCSH
jgi:cathepsin B